MPAPPVRPPPVGPPNVGSRPLSADPARRVVVASEPEMVEATVKRDGTVLRWVAAAPQHGSTDTDQGQRPRDAAAKTEACTVKQIDRAKTEQDGAEDPSTIAMAMATPRRPDRLARARTARNEDPRAEVSQYPGAPAEEGGEDGRNAHDHRIDGEVFGDAAAHACDHMIVGAAPNAPHRSVRIHDDSMSTLPAGDYRDRP